VFLGEWPIFDVYNGVKYDVLNELKKALIMNRVLSTTTASVTELKRNYAHVLEASEEEPVAILNHNRPEAYLLPATYYEKMLAYIEDLEDARLVNERTDGPFVKVNLDEL